MLQVPRKITSQMQLRFHTFSIVVAGAQNPNIINHDFLIKQRIIPANTPEPRAIILPPYAQLVYKNFQITVEQSRFRIDQKFRSPSDHFIGKTVRNYYARLGHTPLSAYGFNFTGEVIWNSPEEYNEFRNEDVVLGKLGKSAIKDPDWKLGQILRYKQGNFVNTITIQPSSDDGKSPIDSNSHRELPSNALATLRKEIASPIKLFREIEKLLKAILPDSK